MKVVARILVEWWSIPQVFVPKSHRCANSSLFQHVSPGFLRVATPLSIAVLRSRRRDGISSEFDSGLFLLELLELLSGLLCLGFLLLGFSVGLGASCSF